MSQENYWEIEQEYKEWFSEDPPMHCGYSKFADRPWTQILQSSLPLAAGVPEERSEEVWTPFCGQPLVELEMVP